MEFIPLTKIVVPSKRIRRRFDEKAAEELYESIGRQGLFSPLLVRDDGETLIAGERRLRALDQLFSHRRVVLFDGKILDGNVPVVRLHDADAEAALEAELAENDARQQLTWQEKAAAVEALHTLRCAQNPNHTRFDTAKELNRAANNRAVNEDLLVADWLDDDEVRGADSKTEALKIIERRMTAAHRATLARDFKVDPAGDLQCYNLTMQDAFHSIEIPPSDLIIADPPYGVNAGQWDNQSAIPHSYEDSRELSDELCAFIANSIPVKPDAAHAYVFCDTRRFEAISRTFSAAGWRVWPWPIVWNRGGSVGLLPWPHHGPRRTYEAILYAIKGDRRPTAVFPDVISVAHDGSVERGAHKPPALYAELIRRSCLPGDLVIDPCCGTGPVFTAAAACRVRAVGFEPEKDAYNQALKRIEDVKVNGGSNPNPVLSEDDLGI